MSGSAVGLQTVFGTAEETTYGTAVTVDRFYEILNENLERRQKTLQSNGLRGGARNLRRGSRRKVSGHDAGGTVNLEVPTSGFGRWLKHLLGSTPVITSLGGSPAAYSHVYTLGNLQGLSQTVQKQIRDANQNLISAFTLHGTKVLSGEFKISVDELLTVALDLDAQDIETATAAAVASYTTVKLLSFAGATLKIAGSTVANVLDMTCKIENKENTQRYYLGSGGLKREPVDNDFPDVTGDLTAEFLDTTLYNDFVNDTAVSLEADFVGDVISGSNNEALKIVVPEVHFTGETPKVPGPQVITQKLPWEGAADSGGDPGVTITYITKDAAL